MLIIGKFNNILLNLCFQNFSFKLKTVISLTKSKHKSLNSYVIVLSAKIKSNSSIFLYVYMIFQNKNSIIKENWFLLILFLIILLIFELRWDMYLLDFKGNPIWLNIKNKLDFRILRKIAFRNKTVSRCYYYVATNETSSTVFQDSSDFRLYKSNRTCWIALAIYSWLFSTLVYLILINLWLKGYLFFFRNGPSLVQLIIFSILIICVFWFGIEGRLISLMQRLFKKRFVFYTIPLFNLWLDCAHYSSIISYIKHQRVILNREKIKK
jgi:hypothetical protein